PVAAPVEVPVEAPVEVPEIAIHLLAPTGPAPIPGGSRGSGLAAVRQWGSSLWDRALGWGRRIRSDRSRFTMVLALGGAFLFFVLAAVAFSQAHTAQQEAAAARSELEEASAAVVGLGRERDALSDRLLDLEDDLAAAERRADEAEAAARAEWEPLVAENRFLRKAIVVSSAGAEVAGVGLTFDGDPTPDALDAVLDALAAEGVAATFFPSGLALEANPRGWRRAVAAGHELGNATYARLPIDPAAPEATIDGLTAWDEAAGRVIGEGYRATWFRPPLMGGFEDGVGTAEIRSVMAGHGLITALWSIETFYALYSASGPHEAGPDPDAASVAAYVVGEVGGGDIVLLQFGSLDIEAVPAILAGIVAKGLTPGTLTQLIDAQQRAFQGDPGGEGT
ncbi:MAG: polysaccharide deacetylase family protein, partial [Actinobacteria bacterium]|nr:polysaccharide deacetylase family protein [Actinomycetota bacterium]